MLDTLLQCIYTVQGCKTVDEQTCFLRKVREADQRMRAAYHATRQGMVSTSYRNQATQAAYMLRYYIPYSAIINEILEDLFLKRALTLRGDVINTCFFGCGPAPELFGLLRFLRVRFPAATSVRAFLFDKASDDWAFARAIAMDYLLPRVRDRLRIEPNWVRYDLTANRWWHYREHRHIRAIVANATLVTFQNCFNEISPRFYRAVAGNVLSLFRNMRPGGAVILADRFGYRPVAILMTHIAEKVRTNQHGQVLMEPNEEKIIDCEAHLVEMPRELRQRLYSGQGNASPTRFVRYWRLVLLRL